MSNRPLSITFLLWITIFLWASAFIGIRVGLHGYSAGPLALLRLLIATFAMSFVYFFLPNRTPVALKDLPRLCLPGILGTGIYSVALNYGEITIPAGIASFIIGLIPVFTMILAVFFLKESVSKTAWGGVAISLIGLIFIAAGEHAGVSFDYGVLFVLLSAFLGGVYTTLTKTLLTKYHPAQTAFFAMVGGVVITIFYLPQTIAQMQTAPLDADLAILYLGIFPFAIAYNTWSFALKHIPAAKASSYLYAMPIIATVMGVILLGEIPGWLSILGGLISLLGAFVVNRGRIQ